MSKAYIYLVVVLLSSLALMSCGSDKADSDVGDGHCIFGLNQSCNDDPAVSSIHGICTAERRCECVDGFVVNAETGKCRPPICTVGQDHTCNNNPEVSSIHGICQSDGTCECIGDWEKNPETGKCN